MVELKAITKDNVWKVCLLSKTLEDKHRRMVADNSFSLAEAYVNEDAEPRAIYNDDTLIGFIMITYGENRDDSYDMPDLWRFMIAKEFQGKGYGKIALKIVFEEVKEKGYKVLYTSSGLGEGSPLEFYKNLGFTDTGVVEDNELSLKIDL